MRKGRSKRLGLLRVIRLGKTMGSGQCVFDSAALLLANLAYVAEHSGLAAIVVEPWQHRLACSPRSATTRRRSL